MTILFFLSCYPQQACMPKAVSTVIVILKILLQMFLFSVSIVLVFYHRLHRFPRINYLIPSGWLLKNLC